MSRQRQSTRPRQPRRSRRRPRHEIEDKNTEALLEAIEQLDGTARTVHRLSEGFASIAADLRKLAALRALRALSSPREA